MALNVIWFRNHSKLKETVTNARVRTLQANGRNISKTPIGRHMVKPLPKRMLAGNANSITNLRHLPDSKITLNSGRLKATCTKR